jgi:hypothetical protein
MTHGTSVAYLGGMTGKLALPAALALTLALSACGVGNSVSGKKLPNLNDGTATPTATPDPNASQTPTPLPTATATPTSTPVGAPGAPHSIGVANLTDTLIAGSKRQCSYDVVWTHPDGDSTGAGITYRYCMTRYFRTVLEVDNWCDPTMLAVGTQSYPAGTSYFTGRIPAEYYQIISTVTAFRGSLQGGSLSVTQLCPDIR